MAHERATRPTTAQRAHARLAGAANAWHGPTARQRPTCASIICKNALELSMIPLEVCNTIPTVCAYTDKPLPIHFFTTGESSGHPRAHRRGGDGTRPPRWPSGTRPDPDNGLNSTYNPSAYPSRGYWGGRAFGSGGHAPWRRDHVGHPKSPRGEMANSIEPLSYPDYSYGDGLAGDGPGVSGHARTASSMTTAVARPCQWCREGSGGESGVRTGWRGSR